MQDLITIALDATILSFAAMFAIVFVSGYDRWKDAKTTPQPALAVEDKAIALQLAEVWRKTTPLEPIAPVAYAAAAIAPVTCRVSPLEELTVKELRSACTERGIRWNRAGKGGKHMTKGEMIRALSR